jgi:hypothetical protein
MYTPLRQGQLTADQISKAIALEDFRQFNIQLHKNSIKPEQYKNLMKRARDSKEILADLVRRDPRYRDIFHEFLGNMLEIANRPKEDNAAEIMDFIYEMKLVAPPPYSILTTLIPALPYNPPSPAIDTPTNSKAQTLILQPVEVGKFSWSCCPIFWRRQRDTEAQSGINLIS